MSNMQILSPESYITMPWRNGMGNTVELIKEVLPQGDGFTWRLSMADVTTDGHFSNFSGYHRTLLLLEGAGITLDCGEGQNHELTKRLQAARFEGEDPTYARLHHGPIKDFNVMTHRDYCMAEVLTCDQPQSLQLKIDASVLLIYIVQGELQIEAPSFDTLTVPQHHLLVIRSPLRESMQCQGAAFISTQINYNGK